MSPIRPEMRDLYPADWKLRSRFVRFVRAGGRCECEGECGHDHRKPTTHVSVRASGTSRRVTYSGGRCTAVHGEPHPVTGSRVVLTAAHLHDHRPEKAGLLNLKAMCQRCHLAYDAPRRKNR